MSRDQSIDCIQHNASAKAHNLNPDLLAPFQSSDSSDRRVCALVGQKLARANSLETAFGIFTTWE